MRTLCSRLRPARFSRRTARVITAISRPQSPQTIRLAASSCSFLVANFPPLGNYSSLLGNYSFDDDLSWSRALNHHLFDRYFGSEESGHVFVLALHGTEVNGQWMYRRCPIPV